MSLNHDFFLKEQVIALYNLGKARGMPVNFMRFDEFVDYAYKHDYLIIDQARHSSPSLAPQHILLHSRDATLLFDGEKLHWRERGNLMSWLAYSGTEHYIKTKDYSIEAQKTEDGGPIPEGWYLVPQERYQERPDDWWEDIKNALGGGAWPGGRKSWGDQRIWLEPESGTNTYGRTNMSIHGGDVPGSRGCIDLVHSMGDFAKRFKEYRQSMRLEVRYPKKSK